MTEQQTKDYCFSLYLTQIDQMKNADNDSQWEEAIAK